MVVLYQKIFFPKKVSAQIVVFVFAFCIAFFPLPAHAAVKSVAGLHVSAQSAILVNAADGTVLWQKGASEQHPMASTTKIMTALLTLEAAACNNRIVQITPDMLRVEGSSMGLQTGDRIPLSGLAAGMLSTSGNDAATAAAYALAGGPAPFAEKMNHRAQELGMEHTHFVTPSGLDDDNHYSTAADMAKLGCAAMKNEAFAALTAKKTVKVRFAQPDCTRSYTNHNKLLTMYQGCIGVKTGFTKKSGRCLVSCAERNGIRLIVVTLKDPDDWKDHQTLLDYGFSQLQTVVPNDSSYAVSLPLIGGKTPSIQVRGEQGEPLVISKDAKLERCIELPHFLYAPLENGEQVGCIRYKVNGQEVGHTVLTTDRADVVEVSKKNLWQTISEFFVKLFH